MSQLCLCDTINPTLKLSQLFGIVPLKIKHFRPTTPNHDSKLTDVENKKTESCINHEDNDFHCGIVYKFLCFGSISNFVLLIGFMGMLPISYREIRNRMSIIFDGTDMYTFTFQTMAMFVQTLIIVMSGRVFKGKFTKGWSVLTEVYHEMCDSAENLLKIKILSYGISLVIVVESFGYFLFCIWTSVKSIGFYQSCFATYVGTIYQSLITIVPYIFSTLFFIVCLLLRTNYLKLRDILGTIVKSHANSSGKGTIAKKIDTIRIMHEKLDEATRNFEEFFGLQVLVTLVSGCFTMTAGAYASILQGEGISSSRGEQMTLAWGMQLYCAGVFILLILFGGQSVTNAAGSVGPILNAIPFTNLDQESKDQISLFLHKISSFPTTMKALKIITISTTFLATASTNITTYLLVLMQFKLSIENWTWKQHDTNGNGESVTLVPSINSSPLSY